LHRFLIFNILLFSFTTFADQCSFDLKIFDRIVTLPSSCVLQVEKTEDDSDALAVYHCDKDVNVLINKFDYQSLMELQNTVEVTNHKERDINGLTLFHIEATLDTPLGESHNFIDAFCDRKYCVISLGPSNHIATNIESQLKSMPYKAFKQDK